MSPPIRVALDARFPPNAWGGIQHVIEALIAGLSRIEGDDEFLVLATRGASGVLRHVVGGQCRLIDVPDTYGVARGRILFDRLTRANVSLGRAAERAATGLGRRSIPALPTSDGLVEGLGVDVVHFLTPQAFLTTVPSIYQPQDLLHVHHPEGMSPLRVAYRDKAYRVFSEQAAVVGVMTEWGRADLVRSFDLPPSRIAVIPWAPVVGAAGGDRPPAENTSSEASRAPFLLYPAQTWAHKNHVQLLLALAILRDRGLVVPLVCTGRLTDYYATIRMAIAELGLEKQVEFRGFVSESELDALYLSARALVFPSLFEGWGLPVVEAFSHGLPVTCSTSTVLPEVAGGAAQLFDPQDANDIARAITDVWSEPSIRSALIERGKVRVRGLSWDRTARTFVALYRQVAGHSLSPTDTALLAPPTLVA